jgi:hypothetical protein
MNLITRIKLFWFGRRYLINGKLVKMLHDSELIESTSAASAIENGYKPVSIYEVNPEKARLVYKVKAQAVARHSTERAQNLRESTEEFVRQIENIRPERLVFLDIPADKDYQFWIWFEPDSHDVIGCIRVGGNGARSD